MLPLFEQRQIQFVSLFSTTNHTIHSSFGVQQAMLGIEAQLALQDAGAIALLRMGSFKAARCL